MAGTRFDEKLGFNFVQRASRVIWGSKTAKRAEASRRRGVERHTASRLSRRIPGRVLREETRTSCFSFRL